jgi:GT2 family glycosyltransferase
MQGMHQWAAPDQSRASTRVDVLMPVFNSAATLAAALDSILGQTLGNFRIVIVDDGSSDETPRILARMAALDPRIVIVTRPHGGIVDALNSGLAHCTAEFIARHDADDMSYPHRFAEQVAYLDAHPDCIAVSSFARVLDQDGRPNGELATTTPDLSDPTWIPCREPYLLHPFLMVRRRVLLAVGGYRYVYHAEDADLYWRLQQIGQLHVVRKVLGDYRIHAQSVMGRSPLNGRVSAINSQLAAISAVRRRSHGVDLTFEKSTIDLMHASVTATAILDIGKRGLSATESSYLQLAFAAKFLELASYRPYELELDDFRFIRAVLFPAEPQLPPANRAMLRKWRARLCARLLMTGRLRPALMLLSLDTLIETGMRVALKAIGRCLPARVRVPIWYWRARNRASVLQ